MCVVSQLSCNFTKHGVWGLNYRSGCLAAFSLAIKIPWKTEMFYQTEGNRNTSLRILFIFLSSFFFFFFKLLYYLFIYSWPCWVFVAAWAFSLVVACGLLTMVAFFVVERGL